MALSIERASDWIYDKYDGGASDEPDEREAAGAGGDTAVDGGEAVDDGTDAGDESEPSGDESGYALVEVAVGSASWAVYD